MPVVLAGRGAVAAPAVSAAVAAGAGVWELALSEDADRLHATTVRLAAVSSTAASGSLRVYIAPSLEKSLTEAVDRGCA